MDWLLAVIIGGVVFSVSKILQKISLKEEVDPKSFAIIYWLLCGLFSLPIAIIAEGFPLGGLYKWPYLIVMCVFYILAGILGFVSLKKINVSEMSVIGSFSLFWAAIGGFLILGEKFTLMRFFGVLLVMGGIITVFYRDKKIKFGKYEFISFLSAFFYGLAFLTDKYLSPYFPAATYQTTAYLMPIPAIAILFPKSVDKTLLG